MLVTGAAAGFYEATAQILPIFLLVMMVGETRMGVTVPPNKSRLPRSLFIYVVMSFILFAGEIAALIAIASGETRLLRVLVCVAIAASCSLLMMRFLLTTLDAYSEHFSPTTQDRQVRIVLAISIPFLVVTSLALDLGTR